MASESTPCKIYAEKRIMFYNMYKKRTFEQTIDTIDHFLSKPNTVETIFKQIASDQKTNSASKVCYVNALKALSKHAICDELCTEMDAYIREGKLKIQQIEYQNQLDGKEKERWMPWEEILAIYKNLEKLVQDHIQITTYTTYQQYILLSMYVLHPPLRLDFGCVKIVDSLDGISENENYLHKTDDALVLHIGKDKVSKKMGPIDLVLDEKMRAILDKADSLFLKRLYLITHRSSVKEPLNHIEATHKAALALLLRTIPLPSSTAPSKLCVDTIRSAFVTEYLSTPRTMQEKMETAKKMRTSVQMMDVSYVKIAKKPSVELEVELEL